MKLVFDTETTGLWNYKLPKNHPSQPRCVQLGAILVDNDDKVKGEINLIIKPDGWTVPKEASDIHGITNEMAEKYGVPAIVAFAAFSNLVKAADTLVAHNFDYDDKIVQREFDLLGKSAALSAFTSKSAFCTMKASTDILKIPGPRGNKWPSLMEAHKFFFNEGFEGAHDAMADVRACKRVLFELLRRENAKTEISTGAA